MTDVTLKSLAERLARVERQNRLFKAMALVALAALAAAVCIGQIAAPRVVEAEKFVVRDAEGNERMRLGETGIVLLGAAGRPRLKLTVADDVPSVYLFGPGPAGAVYMTSLGMAVHGAGHESVNLGVSVEGRALVSLSDSDDKTRASLTLAETGEPILGLYDAKGNILFSAP